MGLSGGPGGFFWQLKNELPVWFTRFAAFCSLDLPFFFTRFAVFFHSSCRFFHLCIAAFCFSFGDLPFFVTTASPALSPVKFTGALEGWIPKLSVQLPFKLLPVSRCFICHDWSGAFAKQHRNSGLSAKLRWELVAAPCSRRSATLRKHLLHSEMQKAKVPK